MIGFAVGLLIASAIYEARDGKLGQAVTQVVIATVIAMLSA